MKSFFIVSLVFLLHKSFCVSLSNNNSVNWLCLTDLSCINEVVDQVKSGRSVNIGRIKIENKPQVKNEQKEEIFDGVFSFFKGRSVKLTLGSYFIDISASKKHEHFLEVALLQNNTDGRSGRKRMQMFVPAFMVASQVGWYLLALKLVTTLAIKALLVAKLAFFVAAIITIKKLILEPMHVSPPITPFYDNVDPYMVPYDFSTFGHHDLHPLSIAHLGHSDTPLASASAVHHSNPVGAESSVNAVTDIRKSLLNTAASSSASTLTNTKDINRSDNVLGRRPLYYYNYFLKNPFLNIKRNP